MPPPSVPIYRSQCWQISANSNYNSVMSVINTSTHINMSSQLINFPALFHDHQIILNMQSTHYFYIIHYSSLLYLYIFYFTYCSLWDL